MNSLWQRDIIFGISTLWAYAVNNADVQVLDAKEDVVGTDGVEDGTAALVGNVTATEKLNKFTSRHQAIAVGIEGRTFVSHRRKKFIHDVPLNLIGTDLVRDELAITLNNFC